MRNLKRDGHSAAEVEKAMLGLDVRPVLTAHPTESTRRTLLGLATVAAVLAVVAALAIALAVALAIAQPRTPPPPTPTPCPDAIACHALKRKTTTDH